MVSQSVLVCLALVAAAVATEVEQCPGKSLQNLSDSVHLIPCKKLPCKLRKGKTQHITIEFTPDTDIDVVTNQVSAKVFGVPLPFIGVDGTSICDKITTKTGEKASCPVKAGTTYIYKESFPVLSIYPSIDTLVHWQLNNKDTPIVCFEVPAQIV